MAVARTGAAASFEIVFSTADQLPLAPLEAFMGLNCIPSNGKALSGWSNSDEAVQEVATVLRKELGI